MGGEPCDKNEANEAIARGERLLTKINSVPASFFANLEL